MSIDPKEFIIRDEKSQPNLKKAVLLFIFYGDMKSGSKGLSISDISRIMLETQKSHVYNYFNLKRLGTGSDKVREGPIINLVVEAMLLEKSGSGQEKLYYLDQNYLLRLDRGTMNSEMGGLPVDEVIDLVRVQHDKLVGEYKDLSDCISDCTTYVHSSLNALQRNYQAFVDGLGGKRDNFVRSLKNHDPSVSRITKLFSRIAVGDSHEILRWGLDAWAYGMYDQLLGHYLAKKLNLNFEMNRSLASQMLQIILDSQDEEGYWSVGHYERSLKVIDTALVTEVLSMYKKAFSDLEIPKERINKIKKFIEDSLETLGESENAVSFSSVKTPIERQNTILSTGSALICLYKCGVINGRPREEIIREENFVKLLRYLMKMQAKTGGFVKVEPDYLQRPKTEESIAAELETTSLVSKALLGRYNLDLKPSEIRSLTGIDFDPLKAVGFMQSRWSTLEEYTSQINLNVVMDTIHAVMCCGCWPISSNALGWMRRMSTIASPWIEVVGTDFLKLAQLQGGYELITKYRKAIKVIHTVHEMIFCLDIIRDYENNPSGYFERLSDTLNSEIESEDVGNQ